MNYRLMKKFDGVLICLLAFSFTLVVLKVFGVSRIPWSYVVLPLVPVVLIIVVFAALSIGKIGRGSERL